ncbi:protein bicaudal C homolog 1-B-like isoform X2 [Limulus polyphemus]|uniref:Protein bicaudal C homolog 1-B-like isoform X2 n=1 Tax=Limulus polyphemus TaxID=6850 RepID=A0ABM1SQJ9_LIMPO|nr:protein bicaudal C homolog 1-B-like isoform X2 [Limulus polyphemus]
MRLAGDDQKAVGTTCGLFNEDVSGVQEERFRVDRRKLEQMLQGGAPDGGPRTAEDFFRKIMEETDTQISWPSKLKIGAKSKKDPHIKICGRPEAVSGAREKILEVLDTKKNRVTLKMDVSYTDHSHIIGKGGNNIQQVMDETGCHIHFPDSNRTSLAEKSNQVSIAGQATEAEKARCRIRELLPLVFSFQLPSTGFQAPPDPSSQTLLMLQQKYGFTMSVRQWSCGSNTIIVIRGCRKDFHRIRQGVSELMEYLTGNNMPGLPVTLSLEISPQHHSFVMGRNGYNIRLIIQHSGAAIAFPDVKVPTSSGGESLTTMQPNKSTVTITGQLDCVYLAWQELMGFLPLVLMFDLKDGQDVEPVVIHSLMEQLKVNITLRPKPKQNGKSVTVRGAERDSRALFEVRRQLLGLDRSDVPLCCEKHAFSLFLSSMSMNGGNSPQDQLVRELSKITGSIGDGIPATANPANSVFLLNNLQTSSHLPLNSLPFTPANSLQNPHFSTFLSLFTQFLQSTNTPAISYNHLLPVSSQNYSNSIDVNKRNNWPVYGGNYFDPRTSSSVERGFSGSSRSSSISSPSISPRQSPVHSICLDPSIQHGFSDDKNTLNSDEAKPYGWEKQPSFPVTTVGPRPIAGRGLSVDKEDTLGLAGLSMSVAAGGPSLSRTMSTSSLASGSLDQCRENTNRCDLRTVGCERAFKHAFPFDYEEGKFQATRAMQRPVSAQARVPTSVWAGQGFSKSTPEYLFRDKLRECRNRDVFEALKEEHYDLSSEWGFSQRDQTDMQNFKPVDQHSHFQNGDGPFCNSNYFDSVYPKVPAAMLREVIDLPELFRKLGLMKYTDVFIQNEIDLGIFLTLTDKDLQKLGIPYSPKLKMLNAISELTSQPTMTARGKIKGFSAAPGAEWHSLLSRLDRERPSSKFVDLQW